MPACGRRRRQECRWAPHLHAAEQQRRVQPVCTHVPQTLCCDPTTPRKLPQCMRIIGVNNKLLFSRPAANRGTRAAWRHVHLVVRGRPGMRLFLMFTKWRACGIATTPRWPARRHLRPCGSGCLLLKPAKHAVCILTKASGEHRPLCWADRCVFWQRQSDRQGTGACALRAEHAIRLFAGKIITPTAACTMLSALGTSGAAYHDAAVRWLSHMPPALASDSRSLHAPAVPAGRQDGSRGERVCGRPAVALMPRP